MSVIPVLLGAALNFWAAFSVFRQGDPALAGVFLFYGFSGLCMAVKVFNA